MIIAHDLRIPFLPSRYFMEWQNKWCTTCWNFLSFFEVPSLWPTMSRSPWRLNGKCWAQRVRICRRSRRSGNQGIDLAWDTCHRGRRYLSFFKITTDTITIIFAGRFLIHVAVARSILQLQGIVVGISLPRHMFFWGMTTTSLQPLLCLLAGIGYVQAVRLAHDFNKHK